ncbi:MAG: 16S rRNA pseudouridine(516) synthase [Eubacterium sp.]
MERIDKIISTELNIARTGARELIKSGKVFLNGVPVKSASLKINEESDILNIGGKEIRFRKYVYIMMNKPEGVISSTDGRKTAEKTVIDILPDEMKRKNLFPAGRLDKNTTGFVLITDDGNFAHRILSPKRHIPKTYIAGLDKPFDNIVLKAFQSGMTIGSDVCMPAVLEAVNGDFKTARVVIKQGMYHQIKRMFKSFGIEVLSLKRIKMGKLCLDEALAPGACRFIDKKELEMILSE